MSPDDGLRALFSKNIPGFWTTVETGGRGTSGVPDAVFISEGRTIWLEFKSVRRGRAVAIQPAQAGWLLSCARHGGHAIIAVRRRCPPGPRRGDACDELHLFDASQVKLLMQHGIPQAPWDPPQLWLANQPKRLGAWKGGPARWDWDDIKAVIIKGNVTGRDPPQSLHGEI